MKITDELLAIEEDLREIAAYGLTFCSNQYDIENYEKIRAIAIRIMHLTTALDYTDFSQVQKAVYGRPTPLLIVDGAVINNKEEILLIRRLDNNQWAFPGGHLNVNENLQEGLVREVEEEVGLKVKPIRVIGLFRNQINNSSCLVSSYTVLFLCNVMEKDPHGDNYINEFEVLEKKWFDLDKIPFNEFSNDFNKRVIITLQFINKSIKTYFE